MEENIFKSFRTKIRSAEVELKMAVFCFVVVCLAWTYQNFDYQIGNLFLRVAAPTLFLSLIMFVWKVIFGKLSGVLTISILMATYFILLGKSFESMFVQYCGVSLLFFLLMIKTFFFLFTNGGEKPSKVYYLVVVILTLSIAGSVFMFRERILNKVIHEYEKFHQGNVESTDREASLVVPATERVNVPSVENIPMDSMKSKDDSGVEKEKGVNEVNNQNISSVEKEKTEVVDTIVLESSQKFSDIGKIYIPRKSELQAYSKSPRYMTGNNFCDINLQMKDALGKEIVDKVRCSTSLEERGIIYSGENLVDGDISTYWATHGYGIGEAIEFTFNRPYHFHGILMWCGCQKNNVVFKKNSIPRVVRLIFDDKYSEAYEVSPNMGSRNMFFMRGQEVMAQKLVVVIEDVFKGEWEDCGISEIKFIAHD